ncbi:MAG TPA: dihydrofolate reductase family protein, partial [Castellaniella sp.]|nr:dihydrofolate reductase family protein [Castellaniella sp.]
SRFIDAGCVDRLHVVVAPFIIGSGRPGLSLPEIDTLDDALRPQCRSFALDEDRLYDLILARAGRPSTST